MPEAMIIYRFYFEGIGMTDQWWIDFNSLSSEEMEQVKPIIERNIFTNIDDLELLPNARKVLNYYRITRDEAEQWMKTSGN